MTEEVIKVKVMHMFPGCQKYKHCCDESWKKELENVRGIPAPRIKDICPIDRTLKKPDGFDGF